MRPIEQIVGDENKAAQKAKDAWILNPAKVQGNSAKLLRAATLALQKLNEQGLAPGNRDQIGLADALIACGVKIVQTPDPIRGYRQEFSNAEEYDHATG